MTAKEFFESQTITDSNSVIDIYSNKYSRFDLIKFAEAYHKSELEKELINFFKYFRDNGERNIGMSIEEFINEYLITK